VARTNVDYTVERYYDDDDDGIGRKRTVADERIVCGQIAWAAGLRCLAVDRAIASPVNISCLDKYRSLSTFDLKQSAPQHVNAMRDSPMQA
jgi:hypothetical protein